MIRENIVLEIRNKLLEIGLKEMQSRISESFFDMDLVVETLFRAFIAGKNVILYGPGGFGKTTVVKEFLKQANLQYSVIIGYEDMDVEGLLGIPDVNKLMNESVYEIAFEKTVFTNPGILVLEEFLDVNPKTAIALKDIITSGGYRQGDQFTESHIGSIVICSNRSPYELSVDHSTTAFYRERFPIVLQVDWKDYSGQKYLNFIEKITTKEDFKKHKEVFKVISELAYRTGKLAAGRVSPRIVKDAVEFLKYNDYDIVNLQFIDGLDTSILWEVKATLDLTTESSTIASIILNVKKRLETLLKIQNPTTRILLDGILEIKAIIARFKKLEVKHINNVGAIKECILKCESTSQVFWNKLEATDINLDVLFES